MLLKKLADLIQRKRSYALLGTFLLGFIPILNVISIVTAAFVTLVISTMEGLWFSIAATLPIILSFLFTFKSAQVLVLALWAGLGVAVISNILTYVFAIMLKKQTSFSSILQIAALFGVLVVSVVHLIYPDIAVWWGVQLEAYAKEAQILTQAGKTAAQKATLENQLEVINASKYFANGIMAALILADAMTQLILARWWQSIVFAPGRLKYELHHIRLSPLAGILFAFSLILSYMSNAVILDIMPILYFLFAAAGMSVIHYFFGALQSKSKWFWLVMLYTIVFLSVPTSLVMLAMIALFDIWLDLRKRFKNLYMKN